MGYKGHCETIRLLAVRATGNTHLTKDNNRPYLMQILTNVLITSGSESSFQGTEVKLTCFSETKEQQYSTFNNPASI